MEGTYITQFVRVKYKVQENCLHNLWIDIRLYLKLGTYNMFSRIKSENMATVPIWVAEMVWQLGILIVKENWRQVMEAKKYELKDMCFDVPESMIQVLEFRIEKHEPRCLEIVPTTELTLMSIPEFEPSSIFIYLNI